MSTITDEMTKTDSALIGRIDAPAIEELASRIDRRQRDRMRPLVIVRPARMEKASAPMLTMLSDFGVAIADVEIERRRLAGEQATDG